jgi:hypothetical protein
MKFKQFKPTQILNIFRCFRPFEEWKKKRGGLLFSDAAYISISFKKPPRTKSVDVGEENKDS